MQQPFAVSAGVFMIIPKEEFEALSERQLESMRQIDELANELLMNSADYPESEEYRIAGEIRGIIHQQTQSDE